MQFSCPHCQQPFEADDSFVGTTVDCPSCNQPFTVEPPHAADDDPIPTYQFSWQYVESSQGNEEAPCPLPDTDTPSDTAMDPPGIKTTCPKCFYPYNIESSDIGAYLTCRVCGKRFRIQAASSAHPPKNSFLPMRKPFVFQCIVLGLAILFTLLFATSAHAQFRYVNSPQAAAVQDAVPAEADGDKLTDREIMNMRANVLALEFFRMNPAYDREDQYSIEPDQLAEIESYRANISAAQTGYYGTRAWYNPGDWFRMIGYTWAEGRNRQALVAMLKGIAQDIRPIHRSEALLREGKGEGEVFYADPERPAYEVLCEHFGVDPQEGSVYVAAVLGLILLLFPLAAIFNTFFAIRLHHECWTALPSAFARMTPRKAVANLFIPLFGLYWAFPSFQGLADDCAEYAARQGRGQGHARHLRAWGLALALSMSAGKIAFIFVYAYVFLNTFAGNSFILFPLSPIVFPIVGLLVAVVQFVTWFFFYRGVTNILDIAPSPTGWKLAR